MNVAGIDTFLLATGIGLIVGSINAYFRYRESGIRAAIRTFTGWVLAFVITGIIASPIASWLLRHVF